METVSKMSRHKRLFDIVVTLVAARVWLAALTVTSLVIFVIDGPPIIYVSKRYVLKDKYNLIFKFRTMVVNAEQLANRDTIQPEPGKVLNIVINDSLYTKTGKVLEKIQFTELPQLIQVLSGTLTLVGNRPMPENMLAAGRKLYPYLDERFSIPSGITGPAQLAGRDKLTDVERLRIEIIYCYICQHAYTPLIDLILLLLTVISRVGFFQNLSVTDIENILFHHVTHEKRQLIESSVNTLINNTTT